MIVYSTNYGNYEAVGAVSGLSGRFVMFTDGKVPLMYIRSRGWEPILVTNPSRTNAEMVREIKFLPYRFLPEAEKVLYVDGSVPINEKLLSLVENEQNYTLIHPARVRGWLDELLKVFVCYHVDLDNCVRLTEWAMGEGFDVQRIQAVQAKLVCQDCSNDDHRRVAEEFWSIYKGFGAFHRDQNIIPLALSRIGVRPRLIDALAHPDLFAATTYQRPGVTWETTFVARKSRWVDNIPLSDILERIDRIHEFVCTISSVVGIPPKRFYETLTSEESIRSSIKNVLQNKAVRDKSVDKTLARQVMDDAIHQMRAARTE